MIIIIVMIIFIPLMFLGSYLEVKSGFSKSNQYIKHTRTLDSELDRIADKAYTYEKSGKIKDAIGEYKSLYNLGSGHISSSSDSFYRYEIGEMQKHYEDCVRSEWEDKADKILDKFLDTYYLITAPTFNDVEKAYRSKKRCLDLWQSYRTSVIDDTDVWHDWIGHMKEYLDCNFDECMLSKEALEKKLSSSIDEMKPEYRRKIALRDKIVDIVHENEPIMRAKLLSTRIEGASEKEIKLCYKELLEKYRIVEHKIGNRYFVELSDKESAKKNKTQRTNTLPD